MRYEKIFQQVESGDGIQPSENCTVLKKKGEKVLVVRCAADDGESVIVKVWRRAGLSGLIYRVFKKSTGACERQCLGTAAELFDDGAKPLEYRKVFHSVFVYDEVLICSDLGDCEDAFEYMKNLYRTDRRAMTEFEDMIIGITCRMLENGLVDIDHRLNNFLVLENAKPVRIDFEHCKCHKQLKRSSGQVGEMLGTLIGSRVFVTQPELDSVHQFCQRLMQRIHVDLNVLIVAQASVDRMLLRQAGEIGIRIDFQIGSQDGF